jgi:hypothetical protein
MQHGNMNGEIAHLLEGLNAPVTAAEETRQAARNAVLPESVLCEPEAEQQAADLDAQRRRPEEGWDNEGGSQAEPGSRPVAGVGGTGKSGNR